jgi:hypothetical protein
MPEQHDRAAERIWRALPAGTREALERALPRTDLQSLLIDVARARAGQATPADLMRRWQQDRFVRPAACDPRRLAAVENRLWQLLPPEFAGVELSPVTPLGTCGAVGPVSQNRVVSTVRGTEVISDSTNVLALEAATRRRGQPSDVATLPPAIASCAPRSSAPGRLRTSACSRWFPVPGTPGLAAPRPGC